MNKFCPNCGNEISENAQFCTNCGAQINANTPNQPTTNNAPKSKLVAGLLGIVLGYIGIHNFYLGYTEKAVVQLLVSLIGGLLTCGVATIAIEIWGLVEGIMILTGSIKTDADGIPLT